MRFSYFRTGLTILAGIRPAVGHAAGVLLLGWALTACLYSQSSSLTSHTPARQGFESQTRQNGTCAFQFFNPGYTLFPKTQAPSLFRGLWPSSTRALWGGSSECDLFATTKLAGASAVLGNEGPWDRALGHTELPGIGLGAWNQGPSAPASAQSSAEEGSPGHIFWVVPAFHVAYMKQFKPLTPREKFDEWVQGTYDPRGLGLYAFESATLEHSSRDGFCGYGHGWGGYGKCFGSVELDANISSFFGDFLFPVLMRQDPRYFRLGEGSFGTRMGYAISRVFITHADSGRWIFFSSALSGSVLAAAASNLYYPPQDRGFSSSVDRLGLDLGDTALFNVAAEFWPDIKHKVHRIF